MLDVWEIDKKFHRPYHTLSRKKKSRNSPNKQSYGIFTVFWGKTGFFGVICSRPPISAFAGFGGQKT